MMRVKQLRVDCSKEAIRHNDSYTRQLKSFIDIATHSGLYLEFLYDLDSLKTENKAHARQ
jgi:hypothetical protein